MKSIKPILSFIRENFTVLMIAVLILFLYMKGCFDPKPVDQPQVTVVRDTVIIEHTIREVHYAPKEIKYIPYPVEKIKEVLKDSAKTAKVVTDYYSTRVQKDSLKIDSIGSVDITMYTSQNRVDSTKWTASVKERKITETITIREFYKPRRQLFYGFELSSPIGKTLGVQSFEGGLLYKNKKDDILKLSSGYNFNTQQPQITLGYYKKIHL